jgi:hypothetical protein
MDEQKRTRVAQAEQIHGKYSFGVKISSYG